MGKQARPDFDDYFMNIAVAVKARADCLGSRVGAIVTVANRVVSTGYNGTPYKMKNCTDGGCVRCKHRERYGAGEAYDVCICVHAEQNALMTAARLGIPLGGGVVFTTMRPCFTCLKEMLQCEIQRVVYLEEWQHPDPDIAPQYAALENRVQGGVVRSRYVPGQE